MEFDFSGLCADQLEKLVKRLQALNKSFVKEYTLALTVIYNPAGKDRNDVIVEIEDILRDQITKNEILYTESLNKVQRALAKHLQ